MRRPIVMGGMTSLSLLAVARALLHRQVWADKMFGIPRIGAALLLSYYEADGGWRSAPEIAKLAHISEDTARRTLRKLARIGRVEERVIERAHKYRLIPELAERAMSKLITPAD